MLILGWVTPAVEQYIVVNSADKLEDAGEQNVTMDLEDTGTDMLVDNTMDGLEAPPELPSTGPVFTALPQVAETPAQAVYQPAVTPYSQPRSVFPGQLVQLSSANVDAFLSTSPAQAVTSRQTSACQTGCD